MVDMYGRLTGRPGVCLVTAGPGATNSITGVAGAYAEASPMIHLSGHCATNERIQPFHGVDDWHSPENMFRHITKASVVIEDPNGILETLNKAFSVAIKGRRGPVHVSVPMDKLKAEVNPDRQIVSIVGDGGLLMSLGEMSTAKDLGLNLCIVVFNDAKYGMIREIQQEHYGS